MFFNDYIINFIVVLLFLFVFRELKDEIIINYNIIVNLLNKMNTQIINHKIYSYPKILKTFGSNNENSNDTYSLYEYDTKLIMFQHLNYYLEDFILFENIKEIIIFFKVNYDNRLHSRHYCYLLYYALINNLININNINIYLLDNKSYGKFINSTEMIYNEFYYYKPNKEDDKTLQDIFKEKNIIVKFM